MNIYFKVGFLILILIFGWMIILPFIRDAQVGTDIVFFGMGDADSILIRNKAGTILIETGLKEDRESLGDKLRTLGVKRIDYMILTHPDKDHIGGAGYILDNFQVENLIQSKLEKGNKAEVRIGRSLEEKPVNNMILEEDYEFILGDLEIVIYAPLEDHYEKSNDYSLITLIKDRDLNYLFPGDAEEDLLSELLDKDIPSIDLYKLPHHGKWNSNSEKMIAKISPRISVVTNDRADERVVDALNREDSEIYYAFDQDIHFFSDGRRIKIR